MSGNGHLMFQIIGINRLELTGLEVKVLFFLKFISLEVKILTILYHPHRKMQASEGNEQGLH